MRFLRMFTNSLMAGALSAAYLTVLVLQLNPQVPLLSSTTWRWFLTLDLTYGLHLAVAFYALIVTREFFSMSTLSPGWASVRVLAWLSAAGAAVAAVLMWLNLNAFRASLGEIAARRMMAGTLATGAAAVVLLGIAVAHYSYGRRGSRVGGSLFTLAALGFLGYGIQPTQAAEWGYDVQRAIADAGAGIWWTGLFPGLAIVLLVTGFTLVGEGLNDILNPLIRFRRVRRPKIPTDSADGER